MPARSYALFFSNETTGFKGAVVQEGFIEGEIHIFGQSLRSQYIVWVEKLGCVFKTTKSESICPCVPITVPAGQIS